MAVVIEEELYLPGVVSGWQITDDFQYEFGGLLFGHGTPFIVERVRGLLGRESSSEDGRAASSAGSMAGFQTMLPKIIEFDIVIDSTGGEDGIEALLAQAAEAFQDPPIAYNTYVGDYAVHGNYPLHAATQLAFRRPGYGLPRVIYARYKRSHIDSEYALAHGRGRLSVQLEANDPIIYSMFPTRYSIHMDASDLSADLTVTNNGNFSGGYPPFISVSPGNFTNPTFARRWTDEFGIDREDRVAFSTYVNHWLGVDAKFCITRPHTIARFASEDEWWHVHSGEQVFRFTRASGGGPVTVTFITRDTWP